jgi:fimbrial chaperone protein
LRLVLVLAILIAFGSSLAAADVKAASLEISPVIVTFAPGQTAATIVVQNHGDEPASVQARAFSWVQTGDDDTLNPTHDLVLSPPIFTIAADASQTMRLLLRGAGGSADRSYRLLLDEVPPADSRNKQIVIALRMSLPVIVTTASSAPATLQWRLERGPMGETELTAVNHGQAYDRVAAIDVTLSNGSHPKLIPLGKNTYVLPGAQRHWIVQASGGAPSGPLRLNVTTQAGKSEQTLAP